MPFDLMIIVASIRYRHSAILGLAPIVQGRTWLSNPIPVDAAVSFQVARGEDTTKCLTCRIVDDLKAGRVQPPAAIRRPRESPAL